MQWSNFEIVFHRGSIVTSQLASSRVSLLFYLIACLLARIVRLFLRKEEKLKLNGEKVRLKWLIRCRDSLLCFLHSIHQIYDQLIFSSAYIYIYIFSLLDMRLRKETVSKVDMIGEVVENWLIICIKMQVEIREKKKKKTLLFRRRIVVNFATPWNK